MMNRYIVAGLGLLAPILACGGAPVTPSAPLPSLSDVSPAEWQALSARRVFFGHQSVGRNIMAGLDEVLAAHPEIRLRVVESKDLTTQSAPGFYHAAVGRNQFPGEKSDEFVQIAARGLATPGSVGMVKFCYVDVNQNVAPEALFADYERKIEALKAANPGLAIVHFTMPLFADEGVINYWKDKVRGSPTERDRNVVRNRYNDLLREAYVGKDPVFDIATLESTREDGSRAFFRRGDREVYVLAPEFTYDGGHLGETSRRRIAEQLLIFLARLPASGSAPLAS